MKKNRSGWDGKIRLLKHSGMIYSGLIPVIENFCLRNSIEISGVTLDKNDSEFGGKEFLKILKLPSYIEDREFQNFALEQSIYHKRCVLESATSSGKSLLIYALTKYFKDKKILIIVPTISLTGQMESHFKEYEQSKGELEDPIHKIYHGKEKNLDSRITISTFQSLVKMYPDDFKQIDMVICDEVHRGTSSSITKIMEWCVNADIRIGMTGSLNESKTDEMVLRGLFGPIVKVVKAKAAIKQGFSSPLNINIKLLKHKKPRPKFKSYIEEIDWILSDKKRMRYIIDLVKSLKGHTLILFRYTDKHGKIIRDILEKESNKKVLYIDKDVKDRNEVRDYVADNYESDIIASMGTTSTGTDIPKLDNIILAHPYKGKIAILQSMGRGMRKSKGKLSCDWYDIGDYFNYNTTTLRQLKSRIKLYNQEGYYDYEIEEIDMY